MFQKLMCCIINFIQARFNYIIFFSYTSQSFLYRHLYPLCFGVIFLGVLRHNIGVIDNAVIKVDCKSHRPYIIGDIGEIFHPHFRGLDGPGISSKQQHNRLIHRYIRIFSCLLSSLRINIQVTYILYLLSLCCISVIPGMFPYICLVMLLYIIGRSLLTSFFITLLTIDTLSFLSWVDFIYSKYFIFLDSKLVEKIQHGQLIA